MEISKVDLLGFLTKLSLNNEQSELVAIDLREDGIHGASFVAGVMAYYGQIHSDNIISYKPKGTVAFKDLPKVIVALKRAGERVNLTIGKRRMIIKDGKKKISLSLGDASTISSIREPSLTYKYIIPIDVDILKDIKKDFDIAISPIIQFVLSGNKLKIIVVGDNSDGIERIIDVENPNNITGIGEYGCAHISTFIDCLSAPKVGIGIGEVSTAEGYPITIFEKVGSVEGKFILAPFLSSDEDSKAKPGELGRKLGDVDITE